MDKREKVMKGLETFKADLKPYAGNHADWQKVDDAISMLKAQEPRVMTKRDFENNPMVDANGSLPAWVEYRKMNGIARPVDGWGVINRPWVDGYNDRRFWTSRPTDEQREAVKWE